MGLSRKDKKKDKDERKMYEKAIVRKPGKTIVDGISSNDLGKPIYKKALKQHRNYVEALERCGVEVIVLEADVLFPDSTFVEDTAIVTEKCAIIAQPGVESRSGEEIKIKRRLEEFYDRIEIVESPGTIEGGDVLRVCDHFYIGLSTRTNKEGAKQLINILENYDYTGSTVPLKKALHLKSGIAYLEDDNLLAAGEFIDNPIFNNFNIIKVDDDERYASNCIRVNDYVLVAEGYQKTIKAIERAGYKTIRVDVSEFRKLDGGLSCLSLRF